jgi:hypothetical protein
MSSFNNIIGIDGKLLSLKREDEELPLAAPRRIYGEQSPDMQDYTYSPQVSFSGPQLSH